MAERVTLYLVDTRKEVSVPSGRRTVRGFKYCHDRSGKQAQEDRERKHRGKMERFRRRQHHRAFS